MAIAKFPVHFFHIQYVYNCATFFFFQPLLTIDWRAHWIALMQEMRSGSRNGFDWTKALLTASFIWRLWWLFYDEKWAFIFTKRFSMLPLSRNFSHIFFSARPQRHLLFLKGRDSKTAGQLESETLYRFWGCHHTDVWVQNRCLFKHLCIVEVANLVQSGSVHFPGVQLNILFKSRNCYWVEQNGRLKNVWKKLEISWTRAKLNVQPESIYMSRDFQDGTEAVRNLVRKYAA